MRGGRRKAEGVRYMYSTVLYIMHSCLTIGQWAVGTASWSGAGFRGDWLAHPISPVLQPSDMQTFCLIFFCVFFFLFFLLPVAQPGQPSQPTRLMSPWANSIPFQLPPVTRASTRHPTLASSPRIARSILRYLLPHCIISATFGRLRISRLRR